MEVEEEESGSENEMSDYEEEREEGELSEEDPAMSVPEFEDVLRKHQATWAHVYKGLTAMLGHPNIGLSKLSPRAQLAFYEWVYEHAYLQTHYPLE